MNKEKIQEKIKKEDELIVKQLKAVELRKAKQKEYNSRAYLKRKQKDKKTKQLINSEKKEVQDLFYKNNQELYDTRSSLKLAQKENKEMKNKLKELKNQGSVKQIKSDSSNVVFKINNSNQKEITIKIDI
jgi:hypothetical protein